MWLRHPGQQHAADHGDDIEDRARARGKAENVSRIEHSHCQRRDRDEENERKKKARHRDAHAVLRLVAMKSVAGQINHPGGRGDSDQANDP